MVDVTAGDASFVLEKAGHILDRIESDAVEAAIACEWQHENGAQSAKRALERVSVVRELRRDLKAIIAQSKAREKREADRTVA